MNAIKIIIYDTGHYNRTRHVVQANSYLTIILHPSQIIGILDNAKASYENIFVGGFSLEIHVEII